jgi:hypothetical protein
MSWEAFWRMVAGAAPTVRVATVFRFATGPLDVSSPSPVACRDEATRAPSAATTSWEAPPENALDDSEAPVAASSRTTPCGGASLKGTSLMQVIPWAVHTAGAWNMEPLKLPMAFCVPVVRSRMCSAPPAEVPPA